MSYKKFFYKSIISIIVILLAIGVLVVTIDPNFHYHKPLETLAYKIHRHRYHNYGILRNFDYDAIIIGTSMTENFKSSEADELFGVNSVKAPFSGASFKEIHNAVEKAIQKNPDIKLIIRAIDSYKITEDKDKMRYGSFPDYLYDENYLNDVEYLFNSDTIFSGVLNDVLLYTIKGNETTSFDEYSNSQSRNTFSKEAVLKEYKRSEKITESKGWLTEKQKQRIKENIYANVLKSVAENPQIEFYYFFPPYNMTEFDSYMRGGILEKRIESVKYATELFLEYPNVHVFSFADKYDIVTDFNYYRDPKHYNEDINSKMLEWMAKGEGKLTKDNYQAYFDEMYKFYSTYDYDAMFE